MPFRLVRIDFSDEPRCRFCPNKLTSGKVRILRDDQGDEVQAGPTCAQKHAINHREKVPDLTKAAIEPEEEKGANGRGGSGAGSERSTDEQAEQQRREKAEAYLLLRTEKLKTLRGVFLKQMEEIRHRYAEGNTKPNDYLYISNLMAKADRDMPKLSLQNLQAVYAARFWMQHLLRLTPSEARSTFLKSILEHLEANLSLSSAQVARLNECLSESAGRVRIAPTAFVALSNRKRPK